LNGDARGNYGFLEIIEDFGPTKAGNLARFYAGYIFIKQGDFESALEYLEAFTSSDDLVQARAYALMGDAYMELGNYADAASEYMRAAEYKTNKEISPIYYKKAAVAFESQTDFSRAKDIYDLIVEEFPESSYYQDARKQAARLSGKADE